MASVDIRPRKGGGAGFRMRSRVVGKGLRSGTFETPEAAKRAGEVCDEKSRREVREAKDPRSWLPPSGELGDQRVVEIIIRYKAAKEGMLRRWVKQSMAGLEALIGDPLVSDLTSGWIKDYIRKARAAKKIRRGGNYAFNTIKQHLGVISRAIKWRAETLNVAPPHMPLPLAYFYEIAGEENLRRSQVFPERKRRLEPGEEEAILARLTADDTHHAAHWPHLFALATATGARLAELVLMEWGELQRAAHGWEHWAAPDLHTKADETRVMILNDQASNAFDALEKLRDLSSPRVFHTFPTPGAASSAFCKIKKELALHDFRWHDLRHEGISRLILTQVRMPVTVIMDMVGHKSLKMLKRYANLRPHEYAALMIRTSREPQNSQPPALAPAAAPVRGPGSFGGASSGARFICSIPAALSSCVSPSGQPTLMGGFHGYSVAGQGGPGGWQAGAQPAPAPAPEG